MKRIQSDSQTPMVDRATLNLRRARALRSPFFDSLHRIAAAEIEDRLQEINRTFTDQVVISGYPPIWSRLRPSAAQLPDEDVLDLAPATYDLVVHAMALHEANDPVGQMIQCARALRPDGLFVGVALGGDTLRPLADALAQAEIEVTGGLSPRSLPLGEIRQWGALLGRAGLALPVADELRQEVSWPGFDALVADLRAMGLTNVLTARLRRATRRDVFRRTAEILAETAADPDDPTRIKMRFDFIFLTGWAPHPDQQKPLRPGAARMSLADALKPLQDAP